MHDLERAVLRRYREMGLWARFHARGRLASCPFQAVMECVPKEGLIASLGCGRGVFEIMLALDAPGRRVFGADPDPVKIAEGRRAAAGLPVELHEGDLFRLIEEEPAPLRCFLAADVFYLIPLEAHEDILRRVFARLAPGGLLVIKTMGPTPRWKAAWNVFQESLACRVLRFTHAREGYRSFRSPREWRELLERIGCVDVQWRSVDRGYPHPHAILKAHRDPDRSPRSGG